MSEVLQLRVLCRGVHPRGGNLPRETRFKNKPPDQATPQVIKKLTSNISGSGGRSSASSQKARREPPARNSSPPKGRSERLFSCTVPRGTSPWRRSAERDKGLFAPCLGWRFNGLEIQLLYKNMQVVESSTRYLQDSQDHRGQGIRGYLACKKTHPLRTLH